MGRTPPSVPFSLSVTREGTADQLTPYAFAISVRYASTNSLEGVAIVNFLATFDYAKGFS
jgi:hypothetical protein